MRTDKLAKQRHDTLLKGIARGERAIAAERTMTHAEARKRLARWLK